MPEFGRYAKIPRPESVNAFKKALEEHAAVDVVEQVNDQTLIINRTGGRPPLFAYLSNIYTLGAADVADILAGEDEIDMIVSMSAWSNYTGEAKEHADRKSVV
jgi:hypothetical protein